MNKAIDDMGLTAEEQEMLSGQKAMGSEGIEDTPAPEATPEAEPAPETEAEAPAEAPETDAEPKTEDNPTETPETDPEGGEGDNGTGPSGKMVNLEALHAERAKNKDMNQKFDDMKIQVMALRDQMKASNTEPVAEDVAINPSEDPIGSLDQKIDKLAANQENQQQTQAYQNFANTVKAHEATFVKSNPDYEDAFAYITGKTAEGMRLTNPSVTDSEVMGAIKNNIETLAGQAMKQGRNPAQVIYETAKLYGYTTPVAETAPKKEEKPEVKADDTLEAIEKGQKASKSLASGGVGEKIESTFEDILNSDSPEEFDKLWNEMKKTGKLGN